MILFNPDKNIFGNTLEIHYWFDDESHSMNAAVQNRCEYEVLGIINEVSTLLGIHIEIETEPFGEGGLRKWLKVVKKGEKKSATVTTAVIISLVTVLLTTPIAKITEKAFDKLFEDTELNDLQKEKLRLEIKKLKEESKNNIETIDFNSVIKKKKSNFYETLEKYPKVQKVSYKISDDLKTQETKDLIIERNKFGSYILTSDDLEPIEIDAAIIEIISPVLKKGRYKWTGYYNGEPIHFSMKSTEFKTLVQTRKIEFKNGSSINCHLTINRKIDNEGIEKIASYEVIRVNEYFENDKPIETNEGKKHRRKKEANEQQYDLFAKNEV
ncbi:MAG: hypothetical protein ACJAQR_000919 [Bacteroidia bacterium]|jgi:hypothetical protein